jgi:hypothetical protein
LFLVTLVKTLSNNWRWDNAPSKKAKFSIKIIYSDEGSAADLIYILSGGKVPIRKKN